MASLSENAADINTRDLSLIHPGNREFMIEQFMKRAVKTESGCWEWGRGKRSRPGRAMFFTRRIEAHVASYFLHVGNYPPGKVICQTCCNRRCVNPDHLKADDYDFKVEIEREVRRMAQQMRRSLEPKKPRKSEKPKVIIECDGDPSSPFGWIVTFDLKGERFDLTGGVE